MNSLIHGTTWAMHQQHRLEFIALHTRYITRTQQTRVIGSVLRPMSKYQFHSQASCLHPHVDLMTKPLENEKITCQFSIQISRPFTHRVQCPRLNSNPAICFCVGGSLQPPPLPKPASYRISHAYIKAHFPAFTCTM